MVWRYSPGMSATLTQTPFAASSGHPVSGARDVTISASSRCDLDDSPRRTFKDGNPNNGAGETEPGNLGRDTRSSSSAKAVAVRAPLPVYPYQATHDHITGDGVCVRTRDRATGKVT